MNEQERKQASVRAGNKQASNQGWVLPSSSTEEGKEEGRTLKKLVKQLA